MKIVYVPQVTTINVNLKVYRGTIFVSLTVNARDNHVYVSQVTTIDVNSKEFVV